MNRRALLKDMALLGIAASIPLKKLFAEAHFVKKTGIDGRPFHRWTLGDLELTVVTDGMLHMKPVQPNFAAGVPAATVDSVLTSNFRPTTEVPLSINVLAIRKAGQTIIIDTGTGTGYDMDFGASSGWLPQSLADAGISPDSVTDIILSHAHPDHIGGLFKKDGSLEFPSAQVHISSIEYQFWIAENPDFSKSLLKDDPLLKIMLPATRKVLQSIKPRLKFFDDGTELFGCIRLERAPGHTPGHTVTHIYSNGEEMVHIADLLHSDVLQFAHPDWAFGGDTDVSLARASRVRVMEKLTANKTLTFAYHLPWPGIGHVRRKDSEFEWVMQTYQLPG